MTNKKIKITKRKACAVEYFTPKIKKLSLKYFNSIKEAKAFIKKAGLIKGDYTIS